MSNILNQLTNYQLILKVSTKIYDLSAVVQTSYRFTQKCYIQISPICDDIIGVYVKVKGNRNIDLKDLADNFMNELIDEQVRISTEKEFGIIRDAIVKKAFSPVENKV